MARKPRTQDEDPLAHITAPADLLVPDRQAPGGQRMMNAEEVARELWDDPTDHTTPDCDDRDTGRGWRCTRDPGHPGDHIAGDDLLGKVLATWPQRTEG